MQVNLTVSESRCAYTRKHRIPFPFAQEKKNPLVSIVIPVYNQYRYTQLCLWSILQNTAGISYEVILADDCSTDETQTILERIKNIRVVRTKTNSRFLKNCNNAAQYAQGKYILFLNNDTQVQPGWLSSLLDLAESDDSIGIVGSLLLYPDGTLQEAGGIVFKDASRYCYGRNDLPVKEEYIYRKEVDYISDVSIMLRRSLWSELGGFDECFAPACYEDADLAFQVRERGLKVVYQPKSKVVHFEGRSNGSDVRAGQKAYQVANQKKFLDKWGDVLQKRHGTPKDLFLARDRAWGKKTLLFVDHAILTYDKDCGSRASFQYLKLFTKYGFNVKFLPMHKYPRDYHLESMGQMGIEMVCLMTESRTSLVNWLKRNGRHIDYVYLNRPDVASEFFDILKQYTSAKIIYQGHDLHFRRLQLQYANTRKKDILEKAREIERIEKSLIPRMDVITYFSDEEIKEIKKWGVAKPMSSIPLYLFDIDRADGPRHGYRADDRKDIIFVGGYRHSPNLDATLLLIKEIMPKVWDELPEVKVHLVGANPPEELVAVASDRVQVHGFVSDEELELLYSQIKMAVIPLRFGAGVKGKVLEAIYHEIPVFTTSIGMQAIPKNNCVVVRNSAVELAQEIRRLYNDNVTLNRMSYESKIFIGTHYSEKVACEKFRQWMEF